MYGVDLTPDFMRTRTWAWFLIRLTGLLTRPAVTEQIETARGLTLVKVPTTRLGAILTPPRWPQN